MDIQKSKLIKIIVLITILLIVGLLKQLTRIRLRSDQAIKLVFKRDLDLQENQIFTNKSENITFCKHPTLNEFPADFLPFKESPSYLSSHICS